MSLEDIFLSIVDHADNPFRNERSNKNTRGRARAEKDMASDILKRTREARESDEGDEKDRSVNELFQKDDSNP
jgi:hypothetical protein